MVLMRYRATKDIFQSKPKVVSLLTTKDAATMESTTNRDA